MTAGRLPDGRLLFPLTKFPPLETFYGSLESIIPYDSRGSNLEPTRIVVSHLEVPTSSVTSGASIWPAVFSVTAGLADFVLASYHHNVVPCRRLTKYALQEAMILPVPRVAHMVRRMRRPRHHGVDCDLATEFSSCLLQIRLAAMTPHLRHIGKPLIT